MALCRAGPAPLRCWKRRATFLGLRRWIARVHEIPSLPRAWRLARLSAFWSAHPSTVWLPKKLRQQCRPALQQSAQQRPLLQRFCPAAYSCKRAYCFRLLACLTSFVRVLTWRHGKDQSHRITGRNRCKSSGCHRHQLPGHFAMARHIAAPTSRPSNCCLRSIRHCSSP